MMNVTLPTQSHMQRILDRLEINLTVSWYPNPDKSNHGEIKNKTVHIYDTAEAEAWQTFFHEIYEYKYQQVSRPYRLLVNELIGVIEKLTYNEKEEFLDFLPKLERARKEASC